LCTHPSQGPDCVKVDQPGTVTGGKRRYPVNNTANAAEAIPHFIRRRVLHIVFASTSGHTEYVVNALIDSLKSITPRLGDRGNDRRENAATGFAKRRCSPARLLDLEYREHRGAIESTHVGAAP
jgi:hypothetical protein